MGLTQETRSACDALEKVFLVPFSIENESQQYRDYAQCLNIDLRSIAETFIDRLHATIQTTSAPFLLANQAAHDKHYQGFSMGARIRALSIDAKYDESKEELEARQKDGARKIANAKMDAFSKSEEGIDLLVAETARFLLHLHSSSAIQVVAREILLQGIVSTWSALEMLVGDALTILLDSHPELVTKLLSDQNAKRKFELPKINIDDLACRGFDLSNQMGKLLLGERDLSNIATLKCACDALMDSECLREKISDPKAWRLNQNRHLIVHRRGVVDDEYLRKTGAKLKIGDQLTVSPNEFEVLLRHALSIGSEFVSGLGKLASQSYAGTVTPR